MDPAANLLNPAVLRMSDWPIRVGAFAITRYSDFISQPADQLHNRKQLCPPLWRDLRSITQAGCIEKVSLEFEAVASPSRIVLGHHIAGSIRCSLYKGGHGVRIQERLLLSDLLKSLSLTCTF